MARRDIWILEEDAQQLAHLGASKPSGEHLAEITGQRVEMTRTGADGPRVIPRPRPAAGGSATTAVVGLLVGVMLFSESAFGASNVPSISPDPSAPGLAFISKITDWAYAYGLYGAVLAIVAGGALIWVEHHARNTGGALRAKGYVVGALAGTMVMSLASTAVSLVHGFVS